MSLQQNDRLYQIPQILVGLTGGIATGKSRVSQELVKRGHPVICADTLVKKVYRTTEALDFIRLNYPQSIVDGNIDFKSLRKVAFSTDSNRATIEQFIYQKLPQQFLSEAKNLSSPLIYDVPLLFEKNLQDKVDFIVCVWASRDTQKSRLMARDKISEEEAEKILSAQWPIEKKSPLSNFVINNDSSWEDVLPQIDLLETKLKELRH